jgi:hypothetical protein
MDPSPSLAISIPCPRATSPGRNYCVRLLCPSSLAYPFRARVLDYFVRTTDPAFLPCPVLRVPAFPSVVPNTPSGPLFLRLGPLRINIPRANTVFLQVQSVSLRRLRHRHHPAIGSKPSAALDAF